MIKDIVHFILNLNIIINQIDMKKVYLLLSFGLALNLAAQKGKKNAPPPPPAAAGQCPVMHGATPPPPPPAPHTNPMVNPDGNTNRDWWPNQLDLSILRQHSELCPPLIPP